MIDTSYYHYCTQLANKCNFLCTLSLYEQLQDIVYSSVAVVIKSILNRLRTNILREEQNNIKLQNNILREETSRSILTCASLKKLSTCYIYYIKTALSYMRISDIYDILFGIN